MLRFSAFLACVAGITVAVAVAAINWGVMPPQYAVHDLSSVRVPGGTLIVIVVAVVLIASGAAALSRCKLGAIVLTGCWGFAFGVSFSAAVPGFVMALAAQQEARGVFIALLFWSASAGAVALAGLVMAVIGGVRAFRGQ